MLDYLCGSSVITRVLITGRQKLQNEKKKKKNPKAIVVALKREEGAMSQRIQVVSRIWKRERHGFLSDGMQPY